jgi:hypothetical protein
LDWGGENRGQEEPSAVGGVGVIVELEGLPQPTGELLSQIVEPPVGQIIDMDFSGAKNGSDLLSWLFK